MPDNDRTTDHRHSRPDSDRREGGSVRDLRARRESNRQSVMGRLTVPGVARQQEPPAARNTVTIREPDQMPLPGLRPVDDRDQQQPPATPTSLNGSPGDHHASPAIGATAPVTLAPPPTEIGEPPPSHDGAADRESSGPPRAPRRARSDLRRPPPTRERDQLARIVTATGSRPRRHALLGVAVLVAAVVVATTVLNTSSGSGARGHTSIHSTTIQTALFGGQDPRATERLKAPPPPLHAQGLDKLGADAAKAALFVKRRPHHTATSHADTSSAATDTTPEQPAETSTYEPTETSSTPSYSTTTPAPTQTTPAPTSNSGGSSNGGGSSSTSSRSKTPDYGPTGELGPGSSPDG